VLDCSYIDLETPMGRGFLAMITALAEDERQRIIKSTLKAARSRVPRTPS
jgi:DNA invertase Pin-like site-specific DNA recombinase